MRSNQRLIEQENTIEFSVVEANRIANLIKLKISELNQNFSRLQIANKDKGRAIADDANDAVILCAVEIINEVKKSLPYVRLNLKETFEYAQKLASTFILMSAEDIVWVIVTDLVLIGTKKKKR